MENQADTHFYTNGHDALNVNFMVVYNLGKQYNGIIGKTEYKKGKWIFMYMNSLVFVTQDLLFLHI
jgi:hypothetical protein